MTAACRAAIALLRSGASRSCGAARRAFAWTRGDASHARRAHPWRARRDRCPPARRREHCDPDCVRARSGAAAASRALAIARTAGEVERGGVSDPSGAGSSEGTARELDPLRVSQSRTPKPRGMGFRWIWRSYGIEAVRPCAAASGQPAALRRCPHSAVEPCGFSFLRSRHGKRPTPCGAGLSLEYGAPYGIRTRVLALRGPRPRPLDEGSWGIAASGTGWTTGCKTSMTCAAC